VAPLFNANGNTWRQADWSLDSRPPHKYTRYGPTRPRTCIPSLPWPSIEEQGATKRARPHRTSAWTRSRGRCVTASSMSAEQDAGLVHPVQIVQIVHDRMPALKMPRLQSVPLCHSGYPTSSKPAPKGNRPSHTMQTPSCYPHPDLLWHLLH